MITNVERGVARGLDSALPTRFSLTPKTTLAGQLDGAWWPYSRDLLTELPSLVEALEGRLGRITRAMVNPTRWPVVPHKVSVAGHTVHVGWFTELDPDKMILLSYTVGRFDLLVIPPGTEPDAAVRLLTAAAIPGSVLTAGTLMSDEAATGRRIRDTRSSEETWENDGGSALPPPLRRPVMGARMIFLPGNTRR
ncbi:DUF5994 family protein [Streptomyces sp. NPDC001939]|uniref:DUF5994 family protein n=1 Tax=unclassified Streptomyces TaxID=2593676 RepID=UPI00224EBE1D|nr:DUF5994 family protein [Streptomyces sp. NBC_00401]MCX5085335.1 DUF5994 family protein [Streptomyces sp. NBC_00401]